MIQTHKALFPKSNNFPPKVSQNHSPTFNVEELGKDNFCTFHQASHSEKTYLQWLHNMTSVVTQLLEDQNTNNAEDETDKLGEDDSPLGEDSPSVVLTLEILRGGDVCTT